MTKSEKRTDPDFEIEKALWEQGFFLIAGVDEAGRGAWAGPVSASAVILPARLDIGALFKGVRDSKQMSPKERAAMEMRIRQNAIAYATSFVDNQEIDRIGILHATKLAMTNAIANLNPQPTNLLIDYVRLTQLTIHQCSLTKGDAKSLSIAAASILAKTARDRWMEEQAAAEFPQYAFDQHKGYGTGLHRERIAQFGPCPLHRMSFRPFAKELRLFP